MRELERYGKPTHLADLQIGTACILLAMNCLKAGFTATRTENTWEKILDVLKVGDKFLGTDLQVLLQQLGWTMCYWNPDPSKNAEWDAEDRRLNPPKEGRQWNPVWGGHAARYRTVISRRQYSGKRVDDATTLVGFQSSPPLAFQSVPLFVGTAHDGYHVFPGFFGEVVEAHSTRRLIDRDNIEVSHFNPLGRGGGPRWTLTEKYRSGLIVVP
ncbi:hypothetical protein [Sinorhizobium meliloti]|uniref:hypothetical protein n=1 Tax=Rhizobium meliloti TaxID=382 RepID=UPI00299D7815|nr:hypothetical protein [Sinorhizobium meliloti]